MRGARTRTADGRPLSRDWRIRLAFASFALCFWCATAAGQPVVTDISTDGTLGPLARISGVRRVSRAGNVYFDHEISELFGSRPSGGRNLFHSFERFNIRRNDIVRFTARLPTDNVISRVTGGVPSHIRGTIRSAIPGADLYLLNPSGVLFGPAARLDVQGSFHVSTAPVLYFADQSRFSTARDDTSLLSVSDPAEFGFLAPNAAISSLAGIAFQGAALGTPPGRTIEIVGGNLYFSNSEIRSPGGRIEIRGAALTADSGTNVNTDSPDGAGTVSVDITGDITIRDKARFSSSNCFDALFYCVGSAGDAGTVRIVGGSLKLESSRIEAESQGIGSGGEIYIETGRLVMTGDSRVNAGNRDFDPDSEGHPERIGTGNPAGSIEVRASEAIVLINMDGLEENGFINGASNSATGGSILVSTPIFFARGRSGISARSSGNGPPTQIVLRADRVFLLDGAQINAQTINGWGSGTGPGSSIQISAGESIEISGRLSPEERESGILASVFRRNDEPPLAPLEPVIGSPGKIHVTTPRLTLSNDGLITVEKLDSMVADGEGEIRLDVGTLQMSGQAQITATSASGEAGDITISAQGSIDLDGSRIESESLAENGGDAGNLTINAQNITLNHAASLGTRSTDAGGAGTITLVALGQLAINESAIDTSTNSMLDPTAGGVGTIDITAREVAMRGGEITARTTGTVDGGAISLHLDSFAMREGAVISTSATDGGGAAGKIEITAIGDGALEGGSRIESLARRSGDAGDISITAENLALSHRSVLSTESLSAGAAGTITVRVDDRLALTGSTIDTSTSSRLDSAQIGIGTIDITARELIVTGGTIAARTSGSVDAGSVIVGAETVTMDSGARLTSSSTAAGNGGTIVIRGAAEGRVAREVTLSDSSISTSAGDAAAGDIIIGVGDHLGLSDASTITAGVKDGRGGDIRIASPETVILSDESRILARASGGRGGNIVIDAQVVLTSGDSRIDASANASGADGTVQIDFPEVDIESALTPLATPFVDAATLLGPSCVARGAERRGSLVLAPRRNVPPSPEGWLRAFDAAEAVAHETDGPGATREAFARGAEAFARGAFARASEEWLQAATRSEDLGRDEIRSRALRAAAQAQQAGGNFAASLQPLQRALAISERSGDSAGVASALGALAVAQAALGEDEEAIESFTRALGLAGESGEAEVAAAILNNLGSYHAGVGALDEAQAAYRESIAQGRRTKHRISEAKALSNAARTAIWLEDIDLAIALLRKARLLAQSMPRSVAAAAILIHVAKSHEQIAAAWPSHREPSLLGAHDALTAAIGLAQQMGDQRVLSYALGSLGTLYESENRLAEALHLTREALRAALSGAPELSHRWHWQEGRLLWAQGQANGAVQSFRRAVAAIEEGDQDAPSRNDRRYFERMVAPTYLDLVDSLLRGSEMVEGQDQANALLLEAREVTERLKAAELRDYFRDECLAALEAKARSLDAVGEATAVVYPILLPERTELLVTLPSGLRRYTVDVGSSAVTAEVQRFRVALRGLSRTYLHSGRRLYDWLVRPYGDALAAEAVDTLVFVPGGPLLTVPMAALHDGERFLIERYAIAVAPGLTLVDPRPLDRARVRSFLAGVSASVQGYPALAHVPAELRGVQEIFGGRLLLDQEFELERAEQQLVEIEPSLVHIASHGEFTGDPATSFILAYDGKLTMDRLSKAVSAGRFRDEPLELLMLSGCETAAGDHRAVLGLAGLAVRSGARSAVGSLWPIGDEATLLLVTEFYRALATPSTSRAEALRRSQRELIEHRVFWHPRYWSPFLLISNWL